MTTVIHVVVFVRKTMHIILKIDYIKTMHITLMIDHIKTMHITLMIDYILHIVTG